MVVTEFGILTPKLLQCLNAESPMVVTESGMGAFLKLEHPSKACASIVLTEFGMVIFVMGDKLYKIYSIYTIVWNVVWFNKRRKI